MKSNGRWGFVAPLILLASLLGSCGGGGGDSGEGGGGGSGNVRFTANKTSVLLEYMEGNGSVVSTDVTVTMTGSFTGTLYLGAVATGQGINPQIQLTITSDTQGTFNIVAANGLAVGDYSGTIQLLACSDQACNHQIGNSPVTLSYTTRVHSRLHVSTNQTTLTSTSNAGATQDVTVTLPWHATAFIADVTAGSEFLTVSQPNATTLRLQARAMPSGQRVGLVRVRADVFEETVSVTYNVTPPPAGEFDLRSNPSSISVSAIERTDVAPIDIAVSGPTWEPGLPTVAYEDYHGFSIEWLQLEKTATGYRITPTASRLNAGTHTASILIRGDNNAVPSTNITIPVTFTVGEGLAQPADVERTLDANTTLQSPELRGSVPITLAGGPAVQWTADFRPFTRWFTLTRPSGTTGTALEFVINPAEMSLEYSSRPTTEYVDVTIQTTPYLTPRTFRVNVHQNLAHIRGIAPNYQVAGRPSRHIIRGSGFIANRDWTEHFRVMFDAVGQGNITRVSDEEMLVDLAPTPYGSIVLEARNDVWNVMGWDPIQVVPVRSNTYQAIATGFPVRKLFYDFYRDRVWLIDENAGLGRLLSYGRDVSGWSPYSSAIVPGLKDMVMTNDNRQFWLVTSQGLQFTDAAYPQAPTPINGTGFSPLHVAPHSDSITFTNDWRVWYAFDDGAGISTGINFVDLMSGTGQPTALQSPLIQPHEGPWFTVSGNGERLYISQSATANPRPPLLGLNVRDGVLYQVPNQGTANNLRDAAINMDGSRVIGTQFDVRDLQYVNIGSVEPAHQNYIAMASSVNSEGTRAYVLAYDSTDLANAAAHSTPRVYVFDISTAGAANVRMPLVGYFTVTDYPTCRVSAQCSLRPRAAIAPDGNTLFYAGDQRLLVVPVPDENTLTQANKIRPGVSGIVTTPWRVNTRRH